MKLLLPREHGSWAVLIAPILVGFAAAGGGPAPAALLFCCAALGGFLMRPPLESLFSTRPESGAWPSLALYGALAFGGFLPLLLAYGRLGLLGFLAPAAALLAFNLVVRQGRRSLSLASEISGILILCLGAPAAYYASRGGSGPDAWWAWLLSALFFAAPIFHVKLAALHHRAAGDRSLAGELPRMRTTSAVYHGAALAVATAAALGGLVPATAPLPFAAALAKTWRFGARSPARIDFRRLGYQEVGYSVFFALALAAGYLLR